MSKMVRRNADDKLKLIKMVHNNPILWDSRLPNFKGADEEKSRAWQSIGNEFGVPGRRVARAFKSLRESYRRELALVKTMGEGFQPKWSLYTAMDFLRDVIRERKSVANVVETKLSHSKGENSINKSINRSSLSSVHDDYSFFVKNEIHYKSEIDHDVNPDNRITSTHNGGNSDDMDDNTSEDSNQAHHHHARASQHHPTNSTAISNNEVEELEAIDADFPYPLIIDNSPNNSPTSKQKRRNSFSDDDVAYDHPPMKLQPTVREVLNSKFCGFITAKLNSMEDSEADNLMNRILMLLVHSQNNSNDGAK